jgi:hypothetical protein
MARLSLATWLWASKMLVRDGSGTRARVTVRREREREEIVRGDSERRMTRQRQGCKERAKRARRKRDENDKTETRVQRESEKKARRE